jgi:ketosteroid isomerase-like protein
MRDAERAMSQENVELIRRVFETFNRGGPEAVINAGFWSAGVVWDFSPSGIPGLGVYRGHDEARSFFEHDWFGTFPFEEWEIEAEEMIDHGDQVIVMARQRGRGASSGAAVELEFAQNFTLRDRQIVQVETYVDRARALEAAGLVQ